MSKWWHFWIPIILTASFLIDCIKYIIQEMKRLERLLDQKE